MKESLFWRLIPPPPSKSDTMLKFNDMKKSHYLSADKTKGSKFTYPSSSEDLKREGFPTFKKYRLLYKRNGGTRNSFDGNKNHKKSMRHVERQNKCQQVRSKSFQYHWWTTENFKKMTKKTGTATWELYKTEMHVP